MDTEADRASTDRRGIPFDRPDVCGVKMRRLSAKCPGTRVLDDPHVWKPASFADFQNELDHIVASCPGALAFRGHADSKWLLESSFVRGCKKAILGLEPHQRPSKSIRDSSEYNQALFALLLLKFDLLVRPSSELRQQEESRGIDAMFEMLKRFQQYPQEDACPLKGTFFLDWSYDKNVALFFANSQANCHGARQRSSDGALFICDPPATSTTLMRKGSDTDADHIPVEEVIQRIVERHNASRGAQGPGWPLLFHPPRQLADSQAERQDVIYWAQMDLRYDLDDFWKLQEEDGIQIYVKLILPAGTQTECAHYLEGLAQPINNKYLFPPGNAAADMSKSVSGI